MVLFADPNHFLSELYRTFSSLCHDPEISVRRTAAEGFHEVTSTLYETLTGLMLGGFTFTEIHKPTLQNCLHLESSTRLINAPQPSVHLQLLFWVFVFLSRGMYTHRGFVTEE